jgi:hypothetical protein
MDHEPIFIVGVPRSGTTLLAAMLAAHSRISCGPETHFFRKLARVDADGLVKPEAWPEAALDFICSIEHASFSDSRRIPLIQKYQIEREQIAAYLRQREPSIPNILASVTDQYRAKMGKLRWAEKTPDHILTLAQVRRYFHQAPVIRIIRDPRDVAISLTKVPWGAMSYLEALLLWKRLDEASADFFQTDPCCYSLRYEDLITCPEEELAKLCAFICEEFEPTMLDTSQTGRQLNARNVAWKEKVSQPVDASHQSLWKDKLSRSENQLAEAILGKRLEPLGYPRVGEFARLGEIHPSLSLATKFPGEFQSLASRGIRFWKVDEAESATAQVYLGDPTVEGWVSGSRFNRLWGALGVLMDILRARLSRQPIFWVSGEESNSWTGFTSFIIKSVLSSYKIPAIEQ